MNEPTTNTDSSLRTDNNKNDNATQGKFEILVIGAGIAGLSFIYALKQSQVYKDGLVGYRVIEKRKGPGVDLGYPIHLSFSSRQTLETFLTPPDLEKLHNSQKKIPVHHDGITVSSYSGKEVWRMIRDPGVRPMIERGELVDILREGVEVEYEKEVIGFTHLDKDQGGEGEEGRGTNGGEGKNVQVELSDGEVMRVDLVIGADGMFSSTRTHSVSSHQPKSKSNSKDELEKLPWTTINLRTTSSRVLRWLKDRNGINSIYGDSFSATMIPVGSADSKEEDTSRSNTDDSSTTDILKAEGADNTEINENGVQITGTSEDDTDSHTILEKPGAEDRVRVQDVADDQTAIDNPVSTTNANVPQKTNEPELHKYNKPNNPTPDPSSNAVYIALTVPSKWLNPQFCTKISKCTCEPTIHSLFLRDLENSDGWGRRKGFQLYSLKKTFSGCGRVVLLGDAAHGTVPFCGSGAGSAVVDASELVGVLGRVLGGGEGDLDASLNLYRESSEIRNNALIKESKKLLWLIQGSSEFSRLSRKLIFWGLEMKERFGGERDELESELRERMDRAKEQE